MPPNSSFVDTQSEVLNRQAGITKKTFNKNLQQDFVSKSLFFFIPTSGTYTAPSIKASAGFQAYQSPVTPNNTLEIKGRTTRLQRIKTDIKWEADQLYSFLLSWQSHLAQFGDAPTQNKFFANYLVNEHIYPDQLSALETVWFWGEYQEPVAGQPGLSVNSITGLRKRIMDANATGELTYITVGAVNIGNIIAKTKLFCESLPQLEINAPGAIYCSPAYLKMYQDALYIMGERVIDPRTMQVSLTETQIFMQNKTLKSCAGMGANMGLIFSPMKNNLIMLVPSSDMNETGQYLNILPNLRWYGIHRDLYGIGESQVAVDFEYADRLFVSDTIEL